MNIKDFERLLRNHASEVRQCVNRVLPIKAGRIAKDHFQDNFRQGGFVDQSLAPWKPAKRLGKSKSAASNYPTLLSSRNHLYNSIEYKPGQAKVVIENNVPYAAVHNEGLKAGRGKGFIMPKRQFIGDSEALREKIQRLIEDELRKILGQ